MAFKAVVFDAYGTLFDVAAAARRLAETPGVDPRFHDNWAALAETWRQKQLEYSWLRALSGDYADFWRVTEDALDYALEKHRLETAAPKAELMALYERLEPFAEARTALEALKADDRRLGILSNGAPTMLAAAVRAAEFEALMDAVLSVDALKTFKVKPEVYALAIDAFEAERREILFVSSNGWDVCSAAAYGFTSVWVNRRGDPVDRLAAKPAATLTDLSTLPVIARRLEGGA